MSIFKKLLIATSLIPLVAVPQLANAKNNKNKTPSSYSEPEILPEVVSWFKAEYPRSKASSEEIQEFFGADRMQFLSDLHDCASQSQYFAGIDVKYEPRYSVRAKFTRQARKELNQCTDNKLIIN